MRVAGLDSLVLVGPPGGGKDTVAAGINMPEFAGEVIRPKRWSTRSYHASEHPTDWVHVDRDVFEQAIAGPDPEVSLWWPRSLGSSDIGEPKQKPEPEYYGTERVDPSDHRLKLIVANYAILENPNEAMRDMFGTAMFVDVYASLKTLFDRLEELREEMLPSEYAARKRKILQNRPPIYRPCEPIYTEGRKPHEGQELFRNLVRDVLKGWAPRGYRADDPATLAFEPPLEQKRPIWPHSDRPLG